MSDAERGSVEPSAEANEPYPDEVVEALFAVVKVVSPATERCLRTHIAALRARLESAASPPPAPRAAGAGEPFAWAVATTLGRVWELHEHRAQAEAATAGWKAKSLSVVPLYAGAAPTPGGEAHWPIERIKAAVQDGRDAWWGNEECVSLSRLRIANLRDEALEALGTGSAPPSVAGVSEATKDAERFQWMRDWEERWPLRRAMDPDYLAVGVVDLGEFVDELMRLDDLRAARTAPAPREEPPPLVTGTEYGA
jgi:hypothetical protein